MKSKKRHQSSSDDSEDSEESVKSSSSDSASEGSSVVEHRHKKKRKRDESTGSDTDSEDQKHYKKRKHKKKKKKHGKKKRRSGSADSHSVEDISSVSDGEISPKKKRKHKRKRSKRARSASVDDKEKEHEQRVLSSVIKEPRVSSEEEGQPARTYYQKEYRRSASHEEYEREREVQRFYRGSSKERRLHEQYQHEREPNDRYPHQERYERGREKYGQQVQHNQHNDEYGGRGQRGFNEYKSRNPRFEERRSPDEEFRRRPREEHHSREDPRGFNRFNQFEERGPKRREFDEGREFRERRGPPPPDRFREREFQDRKERFREERFSAERTRDMRRERPPGRPDKPPPPTHREPGIRPGSPDERYKERNRRDNRDSRSDRPRDHPPKPKERKSRFADADESKEYNWGKTEVKTEDGKTQDKEKPNFALSGKLTEEANMVNGVVIKYSEPDDAKQPKRRWRFYPFKGDKALPILYIHRQSAFLIGRDKKVVDISLEHPSISKQHAALQFRATPFTRPDGTQGRRVRPYIIDLDSANGTFVNNKKVEPRRYVELLERDVVKFGFSQRDYVLLHENSKDDAQDDDQEMADAAPPSTDLIKMEKRIKQEIAEDGE